MLIPALNPVLPGKSNPARWSNLPGSAFGLAIAKAAEQSAHPLVIVLDEPRQLQILEAELHFFLSQEQPLPILHFPSWECLPYDVFSPHPSIISERLRILANLPHLENGIVLTTCANLMQRLPPVEYVSGHSLWLTTGQRINIEALRRQLISANYLSVDQVTSPGEFAVRGGLIDLFPMGVDNPFRVDLFDDEIESIRTFDPSTQRSTGHINKIELLPAKEFPMTEQAIKRFRAAFRLKFEGDPRQQTVYSEISKGHTPAGTEFFFSLFFEDTASLFDYLPPEHILILEQDIEQVSQSLWGEIQDRYVSANYTVSRQVLPPDSLYISPDQLAQYIKSRKHIIHHREKSSAQFWVAPFDHHQQFPVDPRKHAPYQPLLNHLTHSSHRILLVTETAGRQDAMRELLHANGLHTVAYNNFKDFYQSQNMNIGLSVAMLERGLKSTFLQIEVITESQLYGDRVFQRRRRSAQSLDPESIIKSLAELNIGDPVVHSEHGIGRYRGLKNLNIAGEETEFLTLEYQDNDKLYIPVLSLNLISRFIGGSPDTAPIHRLGSNQWENAKKRAREKAYDVATELLEVAALRTARGGVAFDIPKDDYQAFVSRFPFEETPDQAQAISEVLADLSVKEPMDRLVCGDVGFGKTEVALRAAYIVASNDRQVAILVPTTLLAQQHYQIFADRFADTPLTIGTLSRFNSKKHASEILSRLKQGLLDIVIGTHRLLQDDVHIKNLGLLIIDEEHRFGVRQKERIKQLKSQVDILTLTATPIPRTLNITLSKLRSISIIATPPNHRLSIKTFIREWNPGLIREACLREIRRGGQVYFLHNDVRTIEKTVQELAELVPEASIDFGHGQMGDLQLEHVMQNFYHQRFNILVCTTIIESGIDIPSANTIIIHRADRFGLAQLHQIRGRVGRSHHQAYAYLLIPDRKLLTKNAEKRLDAIDSMEDLGSGFALASHDLEIRGAGELLGETQSGSIDTIGFSLYSEYLAQAVRSIKSGQIPVESKSNDSHPATVIDVQAPALFPEDYLANAHTRLILYKRIASALSDQELDELQIETIDRFGLLPESAKNLFRLTSIRLQAEKRNIRKIEMTEQGGTIEFGEHPMIDPAIIFQMIQQSPHHYQLSGPNAFRIKGQFTDADERIRKIESVLTVLTREEQV